jgi:hypothetical protein
MSSTQRNTTVAAFFLVLASSVVIVLGEGCQDAGQRMSAATGASSSSFSHMDVSLGEIGTQQSGDKGNAGGGAQSGKGFAQMWAENCIRCHNSRDPRTYTDAEWTVAMHQMRVRANLTAEEHRAILEYLKASN